MRHGVECGPMPNVMAALPNIGGALFNAANFGSRPLLECRAVTLPISYNHDLNTKGPTHIGSTYVAHTSPHSAAAVTSLRH